ncbi:MAG: glutathione S-transferase [Parasphingorhabdus sp.]|jgi:glutathione S-transferase
MHILYGCPFARSALVESVLLELDLPYKLIDVDIHNNQQNERDYLAINPVGLIPTLITPSGERLTETLAICLFLSEQHSEAGLIPASNSPLRGKFLSQLFFISNDLDSRAKTMFYPHRWSTDSEDANRIQKKAVADLKESWQIVNRRLEQEGPYGLGEKLSLLDIAMSLWVAYGLEYPSEINDLFPAVDVVYKSVCEMPGAGKPILRIRDLEEQYRAEQV